jgi:hypothetical protein
MFKFIHQKTIFLYSFLSLLLFTPIILLGAKANDPLICITEEQPINTTLATSVVRVNSQGTTLLNDKPFFPFGFYHVSWGNSSVERNRHLKMIADAGFNTIHASFDTIDASNNKFAKINQYKQFLQEADRLGIKVLTEFDPKERVNLVDELKNYPAILGWNIADDVDNGELTPSKVFNSHCQLKKADPDHLTYISGYTEDNIDDYVNTADAVGVQGYPVGSNRERAFSWLNYIVSLADKAADPERLIIGNVQSFRWNKDNPAAAENPKTPTFAQIRNMTYQSLLGGAKGIIYFAFDSSPDDWNILEHPKLWQEMRSLVPEINQIKPILLQGKLKKLDMKTDNILAGVWTHQKQKLVIIVNTSEQPTTKVALNLSGSKASLMFQETEEQTELIHDLLTTSLDPLGVKVYKIFP